MSRVTTKKISQKTGFAVSTVSAILNNSPNCFAGKEAREKVHKAARELGYYPNLLVKGIKSGKTNTIGLIVPSIDTNVTISKIEIIESLAWDAGYHVFIGYSNNDTRKEEALLSDFMSRRVDGIVLVAGENNGTRPELENLVEKGFPLVIIGNLLGYEDIDCPIVSTDYWYGGKIAAEYLNKLENKKVYYACAEFHKDNPRVKGFASEAEKLGLDVSSCVIREDSLTGQGRCHPLDYMKIGFAAGSSFLKSSGRPCSVFAFNDEVAVGIMKAAFELGMKCPQDLSILGFDDSLIANLLWIPLSTIRQKSEEISNAAFEILLKAIEKNDVLERREHILPELVIRASTESQTDEIRQESEACVR